jgi:bacterioferritin (cytochrome b1)
LNIHLGGTFYGRPRAVSSIRIRQRYAGIVVAAHMQAAGKSRDEIMAALNVGEGHVDFLLAQLDRFTIKERTTDKC